MEVSGRGDALSSVEEDLLQRGGQGAVPHDRFRISDEDEVTGIDLAQHAETAYDFGGIHTSHTPSAAVTDADEEEAARDEEGVVAR